MNAEARKRIREFLAQQRTRLTRDQWMQSYLSWAKGGRGWNPFGLGGTDINTALAWYQHIYKPGCREWRPKIIMRAVVESAGAGGVVEKLLRNKEAGGERTSDSL